jgi:hypothetical protein
MNEQMIDANKLTRAALKAIAELDVPCEVATVFEVPQHAEWCIEFTPCYGLLCVQSQDQDGVDFSNEEIIKTIKAHLAHRDELRAQPSDR